VQAVHQAGAQAEITEEGSRLLETADKVFDIISATEQKFNLWGSKASPFIVVSLLPCRCCRISVAGAEKPLFECSPEP
jgi:hypothetical protein